VYSCSGKKKKIRAGFDMSDRAIPLLELESRSQWKEKSYIFEWRIVSRLHVTLQVPVIVKYSLSHI
jgi:hypothetical protein